MMAQGQGDDLSALRTKIAALEQRLGIPLKQQLGAQASASGESRAHALQLPNTGKSQTISAWMAAMADRNDVIVEWTAHEIAGTAGSAVSANSCCCCCCCCHETSAVTSAG
jgi:hypothetical protein